MTIIRQLSSSALRHLCTFCWFPAERMEMLKTNCHMGRRLHLRRRCFRQLDVNLPLIVRAGFTSGKRRTKKTHGILEAHVLQNSPRHPQKNRTTGSHQKIHPKSNSPSYILVKSSVSTVLNILVFLPRGFLTFPGKKTQKP